MNIYTSVFGKIEYILGQNLSVCHNGDELWFKLIENLFKLPVFQGLRLINRNVFAYRVLFDGRRCKLVSSALWLVGLCYRAAYVKTVRHKYIQTRNGKIGRSHKKNFHCCVSILVS